MFFHIVGASLLEEMKFDDHKQILGKSKPVHLLVCLNLICLDRNIRNGNSTIYVRS